MRKALAVGVPFLLASTILLQTGMARSQAAVAVGTGVWSVGGRVSTLEMVGLNPQPEPPSRPALVLLYTSGASVVVITPTCARLSAGVLRATGQGSDGRWYQVKVVDVGLPIGRSGDRVGIASLAYPPNPCSDPGAITALTVGDFLIR